MNMQRSKRSIHSLLAVITTTTASLVFAASSFPVGDYSAGQIRLRFDASGHVRVTQGEQVLVDGAFTAQADRITLTDKSGPMACEKGQETGVYRWKLEQDVMSFIKVDDRCDGRSGDLVAQAWKRQQ